MKKTILSFTVIAGIAATLLTGCTPPDKVDCTADENITNGGYIGGHSILGGYYTFDDSITISNPTALDRKITIKDERLGTTITGTFDKYDCSKVILDSIFITSQTIETVTLLNIRAAGTGIVIGNKVTTVINIKSGTAIASGIGTIPIAGQSLTGTFTKQ